MKLKAYQAITACFNLLKLRFQWYDLCSSSCKFRLQHNRVKERIHRRMKNRRRETSHIGDEAAPMQYKDVLMWQPVVARLRPRLPREEAGEHFASTPFAAEKDLPMQVFSTRT